MLFLCLGECRSVNIKMLIGYVDARLEKENRDLQFRQYVADALYVMAENMAEAFGGKCLSERFCDILFPRNEDVRTGDDVAQDVVCQICFEGGERG